MNSARCRAARSRRRPNRGLPLLAVLLPLSLATACAGCADRQEDRLVDAAPPPTRITVAGRTVTVELALTFDQRSSGLMGRTHLDADAGMLFIFTDDQPRTFWMRNTLIPLDIVFLDRDGTVQNVADALPGVEQPGYHSQRAARMVLELNEGWCAQHGLRSGDRVTVPGEFLAQAEP